MPEQLRQVIEDLGADKIVTVHHSKFAFLKIIPDEDHSFTKNTAEAALYASDWLSKQIHSYAE